MKQLLDRLIKEFENGKTTWGKNELLLFIRKIYIEEVDKLLEKEKEK